MGKARITKITSPFPLTMTIRKPVLTGSTAKNRRTVGRFVDSAIKKERAQVASHRASCDTIEGAATLTTSRVAANVHRGRYASVAMSIHTNGGCSTGAASNTVIRSMTLDLKTGKRVPLSRFVASRAESTRIAALSYVRASDSCFADAPVQGEWSSPWSGWSLSASGVRFWYLPGALAGPACGTVAVVVPWRELAKSTEIKGKKRTQLWVRGLTRVDGGYLLGQYAAIGTRDHLVATMIAWLDGEGTCQVGVRRGKTAVLFDRLTAERSKLKFTGSWTKPKAALGKGWRRATSSEKRQIMSQSSIDPFTCLE